MKFQHKTVLIFIFYLGTVSRKTGEKIDAFLRYFWHQKMILHLFSKNSPFLRKKEVKDIYEA